MPTPEEAFMAKVNAMAPSAPASTPPASTPEEAFMAKVNALTPSPPATPESETVSPEELFMAEVQARTTPEGGVLTPRQMERSGWQSLTGRQKLYSARQQIALAKTEAVGRGLGVPPEKQTPLGAVMGSKPVRGAWWLLDKMSRPGNAVRSVINGIQNGEDVTTLMKHFDMAALWSTDERVDFEDILDDANPKIREGIEYALSQFTGGAINKKWADRIMNFTGDLATDPTMYIPGSWITKAAKMSPLITRSAKSAKVFAEALGLEEKLPAAFRETIARGVGIGAIDEGKLAMINSKHYVASGLQEDVVAFYKKTKPMRKNHGSIAARLAEETHPEEAVAFAQAMRNNPTGMGPVAATMLSDFERFRNPEAIRQLAAIKDQKMFDLIVDASQDIPKMQTKMDALLASQGVHQGDLRSTLLRKQAELDAKLDKTAKIIFVREFEKQAIKAKLINERLSGKGEILKKLLGKGKMEDMKRAAALFSPSPQAMAKDPKLWDEALKKFLEDLQPGMADALQSINKDQSALKAVMDAMHDTVLSRVTGSAKIQRVQGEMAHVADLIEKVPRYVPHVLTYEAMERLAKKVVGAGKWGTGVFHDPRTAADISRKFVEEGRPLSFEEVESIILKHSTTDQTTLKRGSEIGAALVTPLRKFEANPAKRVWDYFKGSRGEIVNFNDMDAALLMGTQADRTARSYSVAEYLNQMSKTFGLTDQQVRSLSPGVAKRFVKLSGTGLGEALVQKMPHLKDVWFADIHSKPILQAMDRVINPAPVLKYFDTMQNLWKSYQLPLFASYHTRNYIGNINNMIMAGFMKNPLEWHKDLADAVKVTHLQVAAAKGDVMGMKAIKFFDKAANIHYDGVEFIDHAMRQAAIDTGFMSGEIGQSLAQRGASLGERAASFAKVGTKDWGPVQVGRWIGSSVENNGRMTLFANQIRNGQNVKKAGDTVRKFLGDYRSEIMTPFEQKALARAFPFYRWSRFNIPLQVEQLVINQPHRARMLAALHGQKDLLGAGLGMDAANLPGWIPDWVRETAGVPVRRDEKTGELQFFIMENWHPSFDIDNMLTARSIVKFMATSATPFLNKGAEFAAGKSLYTGQELRGRKQEFLGKQLDAELVNQLRTFRILSELDRMDPLGTFHNFRQSAKASTKEKLARLAGMTIVRVNPAREMIRYRQEQLDQLNRDIGSARTMRRVEAGQEKGE